MQKRVSCRAIIFDNERMVSMYRENGDRVYYTFPGGGMEKNETEEECVVREVKEEFGIDIKPVKKVYVYEDEKSIQNFYLCDWLKGELGSGVGEEFQDDRNKGVYVPSLIYVKKIQDLPLMPPIVAKQLVEDVKKYNYKLSKEVIEMKGE